MATRCRRWCVAVASGLLALAGGLAQAAEVWLQTSTVGHAAPIMRVAADLRRDAVVTVSDDKTARIWSLSDGRLVAVLRPRVGPARDGRQFGVALHPHDDVVAIGGSQQRAAGREPMLWLYQLSTGRFLRTVPALGEHVRRLRFSTDGRLLLACYAEPGALRAFDVATGALVLEQPMEGDCLATAVRGDLVAAASRSPDGNLPGGRDGTAWVWRQSGGRLEPVASFGAGGDALSVDFSPDGRRLAVGYFTRGLGAAVLDAGSGAVLAWLRTDRDVEERRDYDWISRTQAVVWSLDGTQVYAAGSTERGRGPVEGRIRAFDARTGALRQEPLVAPDSVLDLAVLPDPGGGERLVWASYVGTWGVTDGQGRERLRPQPAEPEIDFAVRWGAGELMLSPDARTVRWARGVQRQPVSFDLRRRAVGPGRIDGLQPPRTRRGLFGHVADFENDFFPKVNGRTIALRTGEWSRALAYVGDDGDVVLATTERLQRLDRGLRTVWEIRTATDVRAVNASADGRLVVALLNDGTLRWFRAADGALLLSALVMADGWLLWMPTGHFEASHGVESRLGWLVDTPGADAPDFFALGRFRDQYHRPDVIDRVLDELDAPRAVRLADAAIAAQVAARPPAATVAVAAPPAPIVPIVPQAPAATPGPASAAPTPPSTVPLPSVPTPALPSPTASPAPVPTPVPAAQPTPIALPQATPAQAPAPPPTTGPEPPTTVAAGAAVAATPVDRLLVPARLDLPPVLQPLVPLRLGRVASPTVPLRFTLRADQPVQSLRLEARVDGRRVIPTQVRWPSALDGRSVGEAMVPVASGAQVVQLIARAARLASEPVSFQLDGGDARPFEPEVGQGVMYVLAVGVGRYADPRLSSLRLPAKDARDFAEWSRTQGGGLYRDVQVRLLTEAEVTRQAIEDGLAWLRDKVGPDDAGVVFLAGHGQNEDGQAGYRFLPHSFSYELPAQTAVPGSWLVDTLGELRGRAMLFLDSCHAGGVAGRQGVRNDDTARLANTLAAPENAVLVFASSGVRQLSYERDDWPNGAFTMSLLEGLRGAARLQAQPVVTTVSLTPFVRRRVETLTTENGVALQSPVVVVPPHVPVRILSSLSPRR